MRGTEGGVIAILAGLALSLTVAYHVGYAVGAHSK